MADELRSFRSGALCSQPTSCFASCCNEPLDRRASRCSAMGEEYSQKNANERYHQCADNFAPTPVARVLPQEPGGATQERLDQTEHQATPFPAVRYLRQKLPFELPPKASANLHYEDHSAPPILVGYWHAATLEQQSQGCPVLRASFPTRTALG